MNPRLAIFILLGAAYVIIAEMILRSHPSWRVPAIAIFALLIGVLWRFVVRRAA